MGKDSEISWTHHTFNPWWGCLKVSTGCENCYALTLSKRFGHDIWGPAKTTSRRIFGEKHWAEPLKWNAEAKKSGERKRVFCASMADVFEEHPMLDAERAKLWALIEQTPHLDWLLLTKRPENITKMIPIAWLGGMPNNIWCGTSCEDQQRADERIPHLLKVPARVCFLSCEPLLGPVDLSKWLPDMNQPIDHIPDGDAPPGIYDPLSREYYPDHTEIALRWIIAGGESGNGARPMHPDWARSLRDQCVAASVAFHFKQHGEWLHVSQRKNDQSDAPVEAILRGRTHEWPDGSFSVALGKKASGRLLDGVEWSQFPE